MPRQPPQQSQQQPKDTSGRMTTEASQRIQSAADRSNTNQDFKSRAMSAAGRNEQQQQQQRRS
ncbi:hypothetical protein EC973_000127 [Apophysomyces ossiformis]|uniref:SMP domain-containing protein n=1 Tax=Apophysomyces ossiformis TaxID=679940 RepID=A0A8H7EUQ9_9FUNG|nr:hypothetical protein EC973_000127 [Apophysomyces ossiformis]